MHNEAAFALCGRWRVWLQGMLSLRHSCPWQVGMEGAMSPRTTAVLWNICAVPPPPPHPPPHDQCGRYPIVTQRIPGAQEEVSSHRGREHPPCRCSGCTIYSD